MNKNRVFLILVLVVLASFSAAADNIDFPVALADLPEYAGIWQTIDMKSTLRSEKPEYYSSIEAKGQELCSKMPKLTLPIKECMVSMDWHYVTIYVRPAVYEPGTPRNSVKASIYANEAMAADAFNYNLENNYGGTGVEKIGCSTGDRCIQLNTAFDSDKNPQIKTIWILHKNVWIESSTAYTDLDPIPAASAVFSAVMGTEPVDMCSDGIQNQGEEDIDCGGPCPECEYECPEGFIHDGEACVKEESKSEYIILPETADLYGNGADTQEFTVRIIGPDGKPAVKENIEIILTDSKGMLESPGIAEPSVIKTDSRGEAKFIYTSALPPEKKRFKSYPIRIQAKTENYGNPVAYAYLNDARPKITITAEPRSMNDEDRAGVSVITLEIEDPDSESWTYTAGTALGELAFGSDTSGAIITGDIDKDKVRFRWLRPDDKIALRDFEATMDREDMAAYNSFGDNLKRSLTDTAEDQAGKTQSDAGAYLKDLGSSWDYVKEDYNRLKTSSSSKTEKVLNMLSFGLEGLQVAYGSKSMYDSYKDMEKADSGQMTDQNKGLGGRLKKALEGTRDAFIGYGVDLLQSRLRAWADAEHEATLDTLRLPVVVKFVVTDETGQSVEQDIMLQYTYHFDPIIHLDRINNPDAR